MTGILFVSVLVFHKVPCLRSSVARCSAHGMTSVADRTTARYSPRLQARAFPACFSHPWPWERSQRTRGTWPGACNSDEPAQRGLFRVILSALRGTSQGCDPELRHRMVFASKRGGDCRKCPLNCWIEAKAAPSHSSQQNAEAPRLRRDQRVVSPLHRLPDPTSAFRPCLLGRAALDPTYRVRCPTLASDLIADRSR